jgi:hypothetical protein
MRPNPRAHALLWLLALAPVDGAQHALFAGGHWWYAGDVIPLVIAGFLIYHWYLLDSRVRGYARTAPLNAAVVALGALALPWYFLRSRPPRVALRAALRLAVIFLLYLALQAGGRAVISATA